MTMVTFTRGCLQRSEKENTTARAELIVTLLHNYKSNYGHYSDYLYQLRDNLPPIIKACEGLLTTIFTAPSVFPLTYSRQGNICILRWQEPYVQGEPFREIILKE
jgi:hypothetical protein